MLVLVPLWSSYLARVYAWRLIFAHDGMLNWTLRALGFDGVEIGYTNWAMWMVFSYLWLPFMIMPIFAAIERIPPSLLEASQDLGARGVRAPSRRVVLPLALPGVVAGSIFTFSLTLGDYITPVLVGGPGSDFIGNVVYANVGIANNVPFAAAYAAIPLVVMALYLAFARRLGAFDVCERTAMESTAAADRPAGVGRARRAVPLHAHRAHPRLRLQRVEHPDVADRRTVAAMVRLGVRQRGDPDGAVRCRSRPASIATSIALLLGSAAAFAVHRFTFFGRETVSFFVVLPIALPGIITGMALNSFFVFWGIGLSFWTIVIGHATFCIVIVYNNVIARLRRVPISLEEASMDLGADPWRTFRRVTLPMISTVARRRRAARLRAVLRRGDRHHLHRRRPEHAAAVDLRRHPPRPAAARGERRRARDHGRDLRSGLARLSADQPGQRDGEVT